MTTLSKTTRAAIAAIVISAASISAMPAQAGSTNFGFSFNSGNGIGFSIQAGERGPQFHNVHKKWRRACLDNRRIRGELRRNGFSDIHFGQDRRDKVFVRATRGRWVHTMWVDRCDGQVSRLKRVQRINKWGGGHRDKWGGSHGGLHLEFNFR